MNHIATHSDRPDAHPLRLNPLARPLARPARFAALVAVLLLPAALHAEHGGAHDWINGDGGEFFTPANWNPATVPGAGDDAFFHDRSDGAYTVTFSTVGQEAPATSRFIVGHDDVQLDLARPLFGFWTYTLGSTGGPTTTPSLLLGQGSHTNQFGFTSGNTGRLEIAGGGTLAGVHAVLGRDSGVSPGGLLTWRSRGELTITGQATADFSGNIYVGYEGEGVLTVESGGSTIANRSYIGYSDDSRGETFIRGEDASWEMNSSLEVGRDGGTGSVEIEDGGTVNPGFSLLLGLRGGEGALTVTGTGSALEEAPLLWVGHSGSGQGTVDVLQGGRIGSFHTFIGSSDPSEGTVTIRGEGSEWKAIGTMHVGGDFSQSGGTGTLRVSDGGSYLATELVADVDVQGMRVWHEGKVDLHDEGSAIAVPELDISGGMVRNHDENGQNPGLLFISDDPAPEGWAGTIVGHNGEGALTIQDGGELAVMGVATLGFWENGDGEAVLRDAGTRWEMDGLTVGRAGRGRVDLQPGASVRVHDRVALGSLPESEGSIRLVNPAELDVGDTIDIGVGPSGSGGTGNLVMEFGGFVQIGGAMRIWDDGTVNYDGGQLVVSDSEAETADLAHHLYVGVGNGAGEVSILGGGELLQTSGSAFVGWDGDSSGTITVHGDGSRYANSGGLNVGFNGAGVLNVEAVGRIESASAYIGRNEGSKGDAFLTGGSTWKASGAVYIGGHTAGTGGLGTLTVSGGAVIEADNPIVVWETGVLQGDSGIEADVISHGLVKPGVSPGRLSIFGDYEQKEGGVLQIELAGTDAESEHAVLKVTGVLDLGGTLKVTLTDGFVPRGGDTFTVLEFGNNGQSSPELDLPGLSSGLEWDTGGLLSDGVLRVTESQPVLYSVSANVYPGTAGAVLVDPGGSEFEEGVELRFEALAAGGFVFQRWTWDGVESTENPIFVEVHSDLLLTAVFAPVQEATVWHPVDNLWSFQLAEEWKFHFAHGFMNIVYYPWVYMMQSGEFGAENDWWFIQTEENLSVGDYFLFRASTREWYFTGPDLFPEVWPVD